MMGTTKCTEEEIKVYKKVEKAFRDLTPEEFEAVIERISDFVWNWGKERKKAYSRCRPLAKKYNVTVLELETWYCIDAY